MRRWFVFQHKSRSFQDDEIGGRIKYKKASSVTSRAPQPASKCIIRLSGFVAIVVLMCLAGSARAEEGFFNSNGVQIHYKVSGAGEPVVLIHGFSGSLETW